MWGGRGRDHRPDEGADLPVRWVPPEDGTLVSPLGYPVPLRSLDAMVQAVPAEEPGWDGVVRFTEETERIVPSGSEEFASLLQGFPGVALVRKVDDRAFQVLLTTGSHPARARLVAVAALYDYLVRASAQEPPV